MRRLLLLLAALLALVAGPTPVRAEPEPPATLLRLRVDRPALVKVDLRRAGEILPALARGDPEVWFDGFAMGSVEGTTLTFVAREAGVYSIYPRDAGPPVLNSRSGAGPLPRFVDDDAEATEAIPAAVDSSLFGAVAGASPSVYDAPVGGVWFISRIDPQASVELPLTIPDPGPVAGATATVVLRVAGTHEGPLRLGARWGEADLGEQGSDTAAGPHTLVFQVPADRVRDARVLRVSDRSPPPPKAEARDVSDDRGAIWIDAVWALVAMQRHKGPRLEYEEWRRWWPDPLRRPDRSPIRVRLDAIDGTPLLSPGRDPPDPIEAAKGAQEVIVATRATLPGARRLAEHRSRKGVPAVAVAQADLFDWFVGGTPAAEMVVPFLRELAKAGTEPRFVLLAGDAARNDVEGASWESIPTTYARTKYNGATAADRLFTLPQGKQTGGPAIGRLPFRTAAEMDAYVDRVIAWETKSRPDPTRRMLRFVTSEGRFGAVADRLIENLFANILAKSIPPAYETEVTYASANSPFCWPPREFNAKVVGDLNAGSLYFTYVGHGWADGFDTLRVGKDRYPILLSRDVPQVEVRGTPPAMFVIACTTAQFDDPDHDSVGELLLRRPHGPLAYFGATRICHPFFNSLAGIHLAENLLLGSDRRLGERIRDAVDEVVEPKKDDGRALIEAAEAMATGGREDFGRLYREGQAMYVLLGDPALKVPLPAEDLSVDAKPTEKGLTVTVKGPFLDGTEIRVSVETPRNAAVEGLEPLGGSPSDPKVADVMKANHRKANDKALWRGVVKAADGVATAEAPIPEAWRGKRVHAKAWAVFGDDVHQGAATTAGN